jgi:hypothetical protein
MSIEPNKSSFNSIKKICADLSNMPNVLLTFSDRLNFRGNDLTISCTMSNKEEVFSASIKSLQNTEKELQGSEKEEDFPESINTLYNTVKNYVCDRNFSGTHTTKGVFFSIGGRDREKSKRFVEELKTNYTSLHKDLYNSSPKFLKHMGLYALGQYVNGLTKEQLASHAQKILKRNINNDKGAR